MALSKLLLLAALSALTIEVHAAVAPLANPPNNMEYIGCYEETTGGGPALYSSKGPKADDNTMTIEDCIAQCSDPGPPTSVFMYVGLEYKYQVGGEDSRQSPR